MSNLAFAQTLHILTNADKTECLRLCSAGFRNLSHATQVYLTATGGTHSTEALQSWLRIVDPGCSPKAAGNRMVMQRHPEKYGVAAQDRFTGTIYSPGRGRSTGKPVIAAAEADISAWLGVH